MIRISHGCDNEKFQKDNFTERIDAEETDTSAKKKKNVIH